MIPTNDLSVFIQKNDYDVRCMVARICESLNYPGSPEDIVQDIYLKILTYNIIESYDPHYKGNNIRMSTFIYPIVKNFIISRLKSPENRLVRYQLPDCDPSAEVIDEVDMIVRNNPIAEEVRNIMHNNECSDSIDGIGAELRNFEQRFSESDNNKRYSLSKRKCKNKNEAYNFLKDLSKAYAEEDSEELKEIQHRIENVDEIGCTLLDIFRLLYRGYSNKQIARIYSVSDMSVTNMKHRLAQEMIKFGFECARPALESEPQNGNGHKKNKKRLLTDKEKDIICSEFVKVNGEIKEDVCVRIRAKLSPEISIFQVTGIVVQLHKKVKKGQLKLKNMRNYRKFIQGHRKHWTTYNSEKYQKMKSN